ncbi:MAG: urease accessory protein UreD [Pseudomonadota bacterium]
MAGGAGNASEPGKRGQNCNPLQLSCCGDPDLMQNFQDWNLQEAPLARDLDTTALNAAPVQPRAQGAGEISIATRRGATRLAGLRQQGSAKILLPRTQTPDLQAVFLNTAGGITGGDHFQWQATAGDHTHLSLTTQTAERAYRAQPGQTGRLETELTLAESARIDWLPQETILFDRSSLARRFTVDMAESARLLAVESIILGRAAMGESLIDIHFSDQWRIRRGGRLIYADALRLEGNVAETTARAALLNGDRAFASIALITPQAETLLTPLRATLPCSAGASLIRDGVLTARITAPDSHSLRKHLIPALELLRGAPLPKVWTL